MTSSTSNGHVVTNRNTDASTGSASVNVTTPVHIPVDCSHHHDCNSANTTAPIQVAEKTPCT